MARKKSGIHSKRVKGFALRLNVDHWFTVHQVYVWLCAHGENTPEMDSVIGLMPKVEITPDDFEQARSTGWVESLRWPNLKGTRIFRVRAEHIEGTKQLLRASSAFLLHGQAANTLYRRAQDLDEIAVHDLLVDAAR